MGHATHFLQQLERASLPQAERALALYRDPSLLSALLLELQPPASVERIALSLDEEDNGPYLIVTREGDFVTCLGKEMTLHDLYLVRYQRFLALQEKAKDFLQRRDLAVEMTGDKQISSLLQRLRTKHLNLSREEFRAISSLQPFLAGIFLYALSDDSLFLQDWRPVLLKMKKVRKKYLDTLRIYWNRFWSSTHFLLLFALNGHRPVSPFLELFETDPVTILWYFFVSGEISVAARTLWAQARLGKTLLPFLKERHLTDSTHEGFVQTFFGLLTLGARHKKLRSEISQTLLNQHIAYYTQKRPLFSFPKELTQLLATYFFQHEDSLYEQSLQLSKQAFFEFCQEEHLPSPYRYQQVDEVPEQMAITFALNQTGHFLKEPSHVTHLLLLIPFLARAEAEDFYFPQDFLEASPIPFEPDYLLKMIQSSEECYLGPRRNKRPTQKAGRNDPCPCGSGKKYKKCCLAKEQKQKERENAAKQKEENSTTEQKAMEGIAKQKGQEGTNATKTAQKKNEKEQQEKIEELRKSHSVPTVEEIQKFIGGIEREGQERQKRREEKEEGEN